MTLMATTTMHPATKKRTPANRSWDDVALDAMPNRTFPIFVHGKAEPHNRQLAMASASKPPVLERKEFLSDSRAPMVACEAFSDTLCTKPYLRALRMLLRRLSHCLR